MFEASAKERNRNIHDETEAYLVGTTNEEVKENWKMVAPLLLGRMSTIMTIQKAKDAKGRKLVGRRSMGKCR